MVSRNAKIALLAVLSVVTLCALILAGFGVWLVWIEPLQVRKRFLASECDGLLTVAQRVTKEGERLEAAHWECSASDVAVSCEIVTKDKRLLYLWGIDGRGFYPSNGRALRLCSMKRDAMGLDHYGDDDVISGSVFSGR